MFVFGIISIEVWPTQFPVWGFVLALVRRHITASDRLADSAVARRLLLHHSRRNDSSNHEQTDWVEVSLLYSISRGTIYSWPFSVVTELVIGYALPGRPVAMMMFKTWGYITMAQALTFTSDFKLGHYMKVPPRTMFWAQVVATIIAGTVQLGVQAWMFTNIPDMCATDQPNGFIVCQPDCFRD